MSTLVGKELMIPSRIDKICSSDNVNGRHGPTTEGGMSVI